MELASVPLHETWAAMESLVAEGLVKHIGVCNYNSALIHDLMAYANIKPAMLQVELHPYLTQPSLMRTAAQYGITVTGFSPLGASSYLELSMASEPESVLREETIEEIAVQNRDIFLAAGGESFGYVKALNASWAHAKVIANLVR